jgi:hypothetical protein
MFKKIADSLISILKILLRSRIFVQKKIPRVLCDEKIIILGNGPSLKQTLEQHLPFVMNKKKLCVNAFVESNDYQKIQPDFYVLVDPAFWEKNVRADLRVIRDRIIKSIFNLTNWNLILLIPFEARSNQTFVSEICKNDNIKIIYFNKTTISGLSWFSHFCFKKNLGIPRPQNVLIPSLMLSINMGFKSIFLAGADHSWHQNLIVNDQNELCLNDPHFYNDQEIKYKPIISKSGRPLKLHEQFNAISIILKNYFIIEKYAQYRNSSIFNVSETSFIDAFQRLKID